MCPVSRPRSENCLKPENCPQLVAEGALTVEGAAAVMVAVAGIPSRFRALLRPVASWEALVSRWAVLA